MSDFKITPDDLGRIANTDDAFKTDFKLVLVTDSGAVFEEVETLALYTFSLTGERTNGISVTQHPRLFRWKPILLEAPKLWWNIHKHPETGAITAFSFDEYEHALSGANMQKSLIARIHSEHWHGATEGRFDVPAEEGCNCPIRSTPSGKPIDPCLSEDTCPNWGSPE